MGRNNFIYSSFIGGEVSPKFYGRTNLDSYNQCCEELKNFIVHPQGGASRRPGTRHIVPIVKNNGTSPLGVRLVPFYGTDGSRWQLVITTDNPDVGAGAEYFWHAINATSKVKETMKPLQDDTSLGDPAMAGMWDLFSLQVNLNEIQYAQSADTIILVHAKMRPIKIVYDNTQAEGDRFTIRGAVDPRDDLGKIGYGNRFFAQTPYLLFTDSQLTVTNSGTPGISTITVASGAKTFSPSNVGQMMRFNATALSAVIWINQYINATTIKGQLLDGSQITNPATFGDGGIVGSSWEESTWSNARGWPRTVAFMDSRIVYGGNADSPDSQWFSQTNDIEQIDNRGLESDPGFADPVVATDPFEATLKSTILNEIRWMCPAKTLATGTNSNEFIVQGPDAGLSIGPTNIQTNQETPYGSAYVQAIRSENTTLFLARDRKSFREMVFNFNEDSFTAENLSLIAEHISSRSAFGRAATFGGKPVGGIVAFCKQESPNGIIWAIDVNGALLGLTRERKQNVYAWHYHELAGDSFVTLLGQNFPLKPQIKSISAIQSLAIDSDGTGGEPDEVWMAVLRGAQSDVATSHYGSFIHIEILSQEWDRRTIENDWVTDAEPMVAPVYMDGAYLFNSDHPEYNADGIVQSHYFGEATELSVIINGNYMGEILTDDSAVLDLSSFLTTNQISGDDFWECIVGFNYLAYIVPVVPEVPVSNGGSSQGQLRRIDQMVIHFYRSIGAKVGRKTSTSEENTPVAGLEEIAFPDAANSGDPKPMFTGEKKVDFPQSYERRPQVYIESHLPFPVTITHVVARMAVYEG